MLRKQANDEFCTLLITREIQSIEWEVHASSNALADIIQRQKEYAPINLDDNITNDVSWITRRKLPTKTKKTGCNALVATPKEVH